MFMLCGSRSVAYFGMGVIDISTSAETLSQISRLLESAELSVCQLSRLDVVNPS